MLEAPVRATAPNIERIVDALGSPDFLALPTQVGQLMHRLGPLAQLAENAGGLFGGFRLPGMPGGGTAGPHLHAHADEACGASPVPAQPVASTPAAKKTGAKKTASQEEPRPRRPRPRRAPPRRALRRRAREAALSQRPTNGVGTTRPGRREPRTSIATAVPSTANAGSTNARAMPWPSTG
jgi:hypothetical protein